MKVFKSRYAVLAAGLMLCVGLLVTSGCEDVVSSEDNTTFIIVDPALMTITEPSVITFTVTGVSEDGTLSDEDTFYPPETLLMPLKWEVSDPSLGAIIASGGLNATYQSTGKPGIQIVTVKDQGDAIGQLTINQQW